MNCPNCGRDKGLSILCSSCGHSSSASNSSNEESVRKMIFFRPWHLLAILLVVGYFSLFLFIDTTLNAYFTSDPNYEYLEKGFEYEGKPTTLSEYTRQIDLLFQIESNRHPENSFTPQIGSTFNFVLILLIPLVVYMLYFLPSLIGSYKTSGWAILFLNIFFGWTFLIWVLCLALAFKNNVGAIFSSFNDATKSNEPR